MGRSRRNPQFRKVQVPVMLTPSERDFLNSIGVSDVDAWCTLQARRALADVTPAPELAPVEENRTIRVSLSISEEEEARLREVSHGDRAGWLRRLFRNRAEMAVERRAEREAEAAALAQNASVLAAAVSVDDS